MVAKYTLRNVFAIIDAGDLSRVWFSAPSRSIDSVLTVCRMEAEGPKEPEEAKIFILLGIRSLSDKNFVRSIVLWGDPTCVADEYGVFFKNHGWYVKFRIDEDDDLDEISFHRPERKLRTVGGLVIPAGGKVR